VPSPPPDLAGQLQQCQAVARALGLPVFVEQFYEADDLIGTLAGQATQQDMNVVVVSKDKALLQLVTPHVTFHDAAKDRRFDPAGVAAQTALALLQVFPNLEALYADLARLATLPLRNVKTLRQKLEVGQETAFLSTHLATIALDAPVACAPEVLCSLVAQAAAVTPLFAKLGFQRLSHRIARWQS
jgi:DNA polymerase I